MGNFEAPCGASADQIVSREQLDEPQWLCQAIYLRPATGVIYQDEILLPDKKRTQIVNEVSEPRCKAICDRRECPVYDLNPSDVSEESE